MASLKYFVLIFLAIGGNFLESDSSYAADVLRPKRPRLHAERRPKKLQEKVDLPNYRLPNNTEPVHYDVELTTNVHKGIYEFTGKVSIQINVIEDTRTIVLHTRQLTVTSAKIQSATGQSYDLTQSYDTVVEFLSLTPQDPNVNFRAGEKGTLTLEYNGLLRKDYSGFYMASYLDDNNNRRYLATTEFESTDARHAFPCYDEPAKRATFTIVINHDPSYHAISNMPVDTSKSSSGRTVFETTPKTPTYILAFIVSDFKYIEGKLNSLTQRIYSRPNSHDENGQNALISGMRIIECLIEYLGVDFPLPKLDQVAGSNFAGGATENWGIVTYNEEDLFYAKDIFTIDREHTLNTLIAHEYSHQWFGNLVAIKWWTYLWLKEGFASFFEYEITNQIYPEWGIMQYFHSDYYLQALQIEADMGALTQYVVSPTLGGNYDEVAYGKAATVIYMWQNALTDTVFRRGLKNYLENNKFSAADEMDLFKALQDAVKEENFAIPALVEDMMATWTRQASYPLLTVTRNYEDGSFTILQEAYDSESATEPSNDLWYVPINAAVQSKPDFRQTQATHYMLKTKELKVEDVKPERNEWLILNKQSTGLYRIMYDEENWDLIIHGLMKSPHKIHARNRAQLLGDVFEFAQTNRMKYDVFLKMMTYLTKEDQYAPWFIASAVLTYFNNLLRGDAEYQNFKDYMAILLANIYEKLGVHEVPGEQHLNKNTRQIIIKFACLAGIESCLKETNQKLVELIDKKIEIEVNLKEHIYCNGLRQADDREFDYFFKELMESDDMRTRRALIDGLGCAEKKDQMQKFIESSIDMSNTLNTYLRGKILKAIYPHSAAGLLACIDFLKQNWKEYGMRTPSLPDEKPLDDDIRFMSMYVNNNEQKKSLLELVEIVKDSEYVESGLEEAVLQGSKANLDWLESNRDKIMDWIKNFLGQSESETSGSAKMHASIIGVAAMVALTRLLF